MTLSRGCELGHAAACVSIVVRTCTYVAINNNNIIITVWWAMFGGAAFCGKSQKSLRINLNFVTASNPVQGHWQCANNDDVLINVRFLLYLSQFSKKKKNLDN